MERSLLGRCVAVGVWLLLAVICGASCARRVMPTPIQSESMTPGAAQPSPESEGTERESIAAPTLTSGAPTFGASPTLTPLLSGMTPFPTPSLLPESTSATQVVATHVAITHVVEAGETLIDIMILYGLDGYDSIVWANGLSDPDSIYAGQILEIPGVEVGQIPTPQVIGLSTGNHPIEMYRLGEGALHVALIGGIHGGYEWNTILLAYEVIDYYATFPDRIPSSISLYVIPVANPDGQFPITGRAGRFLPGDVVDLSGYAGRFNANDVDLNRNWDCDWEPVGHLYDIEIDAGSSPFSEVETRILRDFILDEEIDAAIFWHSFAGEVYPGGCDGPFPAAQELAQVYAAAAGYAYQDAFTDYTVSGDAVDWLSRQRIPGIEVELAARTGPEFARNLAGVRAALDYLARGAE